MNKKLIILFILFCRLASAQTETVSSDNPVYKFLKKISVLGVISNYDNVVLPLPRSQILTYLDSAKIYQEKLSSTDKDLLTNYYNKIQVGAQKLSLIEDPLKYLVADSEKVFYRYTDSSVAITVNPVLDAKILYSNEYDKSAALLNLGGSFYGSYDNWLGFSFLASNGMVFGSRQTALKDDRVARSYTFNNTEINFFDATEGHILLKKGIAALQLGREKILWGAGNIDRMMISDSPQLFDFIRFSLEYKALKYDFLHGWLVQKPDLVYVDSLIRSIKLKSAKYIALNRLGINISEDINLGVSQAVIYSGRPVEAAYLNPFLLWESAQRSLNDLDNSFISFDLRWKILCGLELNFSYLFDDINLGRLFDKGWNTVNNRIAFQSGLYFVPSLIPDMTLELEYSYIRPYTFSHTGLNEALTFTNNGYFIGIPVHPNSIKYSARINYAVSARLNFKIDLSLVNHGKNIYSPEGKLLNNFGGNIFEPLTLYDPSTAYMLDGIREKEYRLGLNLTWEIIRDYYGVIDYQYNKITLPDVDTESSFVSLQFRLFFE